MRIVDDAPGKFRGELRIGRAHAMHAGIDFDQHTNGSTMDARVR